MWYKGPFPIFFVFCRHYGIQDFWTEAVGLRMNTKVFLVVEGSLIMNMQRNQMPFEIPMGLTGRAWTNKTRFCTVIRCFVNIIAENKHFDPF